MPHRKHDAISARVLGVRLSSVTVIIVVLTLGSGWGCRTARAPSSSPAIPSTTNHQPARRAPLFQPPAGSALRPRGLTSPASLPTLLAYVRPAVVRIHSENRVFKPFTSYLAGLWEVFKEALAVFPLHRIADDWVDLAFHLVFGSFDLGVRNGSGMVVHPSGLVITNAHVVSNASTLWVEFNDGSALAASVEATAPGLDLALLRITPETKAPGGAQSHTAPPFACLELEPEIPLPGEVALVLGYPGRDLLGSQPLSPDLAPGTTSPIQPTATLGIVSAVNVNLGHPTLRFLQVDAALNPGNSGGPLLDGQGRARGVVVARGGLGKQNEGYAIPIGEVLKQFSESLTGSSDGIPADDSD